MAVLLESIFKVLYVVVLAVVAPVMLLLFCGQIVYNTTWWMDHDNGRVHAAVFESTTKDYYSDVSPPPLQYNTRIQST